MRLLRSLGPIAILIGVVTFVFNFPDIARDRDARAWRLITTKAPGNSGKIPALQYLNKHNPVVLPNPRRWYLPIGPKGADEIGPPAVWEIGQIPGFKKRTSLKGIDLSRPRKHDYADSKSLFYFDDGWAGPGVFLEGIDLQGADLREANFTGASLSGANFSGANLQNADFSGANLTGADFTGAELRGAILRGAILEEAKFSEKTNLSRYQFASACGKLENLPNEFDQPRACRCGKLPEPKIAMRNEADPLPEPYTLTRDMLPKHIGEENPPTESSDDFVVYLNESERRPFQLFFSSGKTYRADGQLFDTSDAFPSEYDGRPRAIFVMDPEGRVYASDCHVDGNFHHSSLIAGEPIAAAGEIEAEKGTITVISRRSGHYYPSEENQAQIIAELERNGIETSNVKVCRGFTNGTPDNCLPNQ